MDPMDPTSSKLDLARNAFHHFSEALSILADSPENQCRRVGDHNVAWELRSDVLAGNYPFMDLILTPEQRKDLIPLFQALEQLPQERLTFGSGRASNLAAMSHPAWEPIRRMAGEALQRLQSRIDQNRAELG